MAKLIPTMTSSMAPAPIKIWGNGNDGGQAPWNAFDGSTSTFYYANSGDSNFLCVDMGELVGISGYTYKPSSNGECADKWVFKGSNDWNGTWDTLDTQTSVTNQANVEQTFNVSPTKKYRFYKWEAIRRGTIGVGLVPELNLLDTTETLTEVDLHIGDEIIPTLSSNTSASPIVISGSDNDSGQAPWHAFDGSLSSFYFAESGGTNNYLKMDLGEAKRIAGYVYTPTGNGNSIINWTLLGSNDDANWDTIDTVASFGKYVADMEFTFVADSLQAYRYYKLYPMNNGGHYALVADFNLLEYVEGAPLTTAPRRFVCAS